MASGNRERLYIILNVIFAIAQAIAPFLADLTGIGTPIGDRPENDTLVTPAPYAFSIWGLIFPAIAAYAIYQALPGQRNNELLQKTRGYTAFAFIACALWSIAAQYLWLWLTVVLMVGILYGLVGALIQIIEHRFSTTSGERTFIVFPVTIYAGWITVATIANTASWLKASGFSNILISDEAWAILMLAVAGAITTFVTLRSRRNFGYALTIVWALIGIIFANLYGKTTSLSVAVLAGTLAAWLFLAALFVQLGSGRQKV